MNSNDIMSVQPMSMHAYLWLRAQRKRRGEFVFDSITYVINGEEKETIFFDEITPPELFNGGISCRT